MDRTLIERYRAGADALHRAIEGLSAEELTAHPVAGTWSIQEIVLHLADSDLIGADRMKRIAAEERPTLVGFDEAAFARHLGYEQQDPKLAAEIFRLNRLMTADLLSRLPDAAFERVGVHNERGEVTLAQQLQTYTEHLDHHFAFVREKRALVGKPLG